MTDIGREFDIRDRRAMVSLGPLSPKRYCTYACAFCYVHADYKSYPSRSVAEIRSFLAAHREEFDIVYVSGDTDSFSPPRTNQGLELLEAISDLDCDLLFTTRAPLESEHLDRVQAVSGRLRSRGKVLIGCVSISRLRTAPHLEPKPVPTPERRLEVLRGLHQRGIVSVLAMRPFLPVIPTAEYVELARMSAEYVDVILGEVWYADSGGLLERQVFGPAAPVAMSFSEHKMDFDDNGAVWKVWAGEQARVAVDDYCRSVGVPFFMRSGPAIAQIRARLAKSSEAGA